MKRQTRRDALKVTAGVAISASLPGQSGEPLRFFTPREFRMVDELTELIVPADAHSPGARAAGVAAYLDRSLAELFEDKTKQVWKNGLKRIDALCHEMHGKPFLDAANEQRIAILSRISQNEMNEKTPDDFFFSELKRRTANAYYTSKIGIHAEMEYKGNAILKDFVGYDPA